MENRRPPARTAATEARRAQILEAALECFATRGYAATTLEDIRARSGASTGSIYHLFASKEQLGGVLYLDGLRAWHDGFLAELAAHGGDDVEATVRATVDYYLRWVAASPRLARFILNTRQAELQPSARDEVVALNRAFFREVKRLLAPHIARGALRAMPLELWTAVVMGPILEYARQWLAGLAKVAPEAARPLLADAIWAAVRGPGEDRRGRGKS